MNHRVTSSSSVSVLCTIAAGGEERECPVQSRGLAARGRTTPITT